MVIYEIEYTTANKLLNAVEMKFVEKTISLIDGAKNNSDMTLSTPLSNLVLMMDGIDYYDIL